MAMTMLSVVGLAMLKMCLNITTPRQWTLQQSITDAYMTFEKASAQRQTFEDITGPDSLWPEFPEVANTEVVLGVLPGGRQITGTVTRTRSADPRNIPKDVVYDPDDPTNPVTVALVENPSRMEVWKLQSVVRYSVGGRTYLKSRTVVRSQ